MRSFPYKANRQFGVFTWAQAHAAGSTRAAITNALDRGRIVSLRRGVYVESDYDQDAAPAARRQQLATRGSGGSGPPGCGRQPRSAAVLSSHCLLTTPKAPCVTVAPGRAC